MNKWIKLDKNNLPSDILVEGKYEFREITPGLPWEGFRTIRDPYNAMSYLKHLSALVEYRKNVVEPKVYTGRVKSLSRYITVSPGVKDVHSKEVTIELAGPVGDVEIKEGDKALIYINKTEEELS